MCVLQRYVVTCGRRRRRPEATHKEKKKKAMMTEEKIGKMEGVGGIGLFIHCCAEVVVSEAEERLASSSSSSSSSKCCRFSPFSPSFPFPTVVACIDRQATARQAGYPPARHCSYGIWRFLGHTGLAIVSAATFSVLLAPSRHSDVPPFCAAPSVLDLN